MEKHFRCVTDVYDMACERQICIKINLDGQTGDPLIV